MQSNKLRMAIRSTAAVAIMGVAAQASAVDLSAGDVDASIYGYAQFNASYDFNEKLGNPNYGSFGSLGVDDDIEGHFGATANQSRIGFTATHTEGVSFTIEGDFEGGSGGFRLRHAYGEYNGFMAGQNWSNYNSWVGNTALFDFNGTAAAAGRQLRNPQVRYTTGPFSFSAEEPTDAGIEDGAQKTSTPAFTARMEDSQGGLSYSAAVMAKQLSHDNGGDDDSAMGYGAFAALKMQVTDMVTVQGAVNYTDGASGYLYQSGAPDGYMDGDSLETISGIGGTVGAGLGLPGGSSLNIGVGMIEMDYDDAISAGASTAADVDESRRNVFLNYTWVPAENVTMGVELSNWEAENAEGDSTDASKIMYISRYSF